MDVYITHRCTRQQSKRPETLWARDGHISFSGWAIFVSLNPEGSWRSKLLAYLPFWARHISHHLQESCDAGSLRVRHVGGNAGLKALTRKGPAHGDDLYDEKKRYLLARMKALHTAECPFDNLPEKPRRGALDTKQMRKAVSGSPGAALHSRIHREN